MNRFLMARSCESPRRRPLGGRWRIRPGGRGGLLLVAATLLAGCEAQVVTPARVVAVELLPAEITLSEGEDAPVSAIATERGGREVSGHRVVWSVDDPGVVTVTPAGIVEARAPGTTLIHGTVEGVAGTATVTVLAGPADPEPSACAFSNRTFGRDVEIPDDAECTFNDVRILGSLKLGMGSTVVAVNLSVEGSIQAKSAGGLTLASSRVDGDIQFEDGADVQVRQTRIDGNLELESNHGSLQVEGNTVDGNVQVFRNGGGPFTIADNDIDGNLQCKENDPAPTGGGNVVEGEKEDQCRSL